MENNPTKKKRQMSTLTEIEIIDLTNDSPPAVTETNSSDSVLSILDRKKPPEMELISRSPKANRKRKEARRVTASPTTSRALTLQERPTNDNDKSLKKNKAIVDGAMESSCEDDLKSESGMGRKRKAAYDSDIENQGDGNTKRKPRIRRKKCNRRSLLGEFDHIEMETAREISSKEFRATNVYDTDEWLSSDEESSSDGKDDNDQSSSTSVSRQAGKFKSKRKRMENREDYLSSIDNDNDKALQILLWELGFGYDVLTHQFRAIRFVAGFVPSFPYEMRKQSDDDSVNSGLYNGEEELLQRDEYGRYARFKALRLEHLRIPGRGMILADEMGLGKTIEALGGAVLRNAVKVQCQKKPTLIITPQDGVMDQWLQALSTAGVEPSRIKVMGEKKTETKKRGGDIKPKNLVQSGEFILCTRYKIQSEMKKLFDYNATSKHSTNKKDSFLFRSVPGELVKKLKKEYDVENGKVDRVRDDRTDEPRPDRVTRFIKNSSLTPKFGTVIIDECHFLRNVVAYWGIGAALLGAQSKRTVLLSGTPYNNGPKDMSALMTFIDPRHVAAQVKWWEKATKSGNRNDIISALSTWKNEYMLRRTKDVIGDKLPPRERRAIDVPVRPSELGVYEWYEAIFLKALNQLQEEIGGTNRKAQREMAEIMIACLACCRMSLIHPSLPGGREITIQFSPSRRHLLSREGKINETRCVLCGDKYPTQKAEKHAAMIAGKFEDENDDDDLRQLLGLTGRGRSDDDMTDDNDDEDLVRRMDTAKKDKDKGPIVELDADICHAAGSNCCHFAHERCIQIFLENGHQNCPRCYDLAARIHPMSSSANKVYCQKTGTTVHSLQGFTASAKLREAILWFQTVPRQDKAIILSFFKGSLDLLEGILESDLDVRCCRYDGDVPKEIRSQDLHRFKTDKSCRVLLASVQSGGTGLNITEANHVLFLDRWFNPQIHDQAESRCHRLGQRKAVKIAYLDASYTVDVVMKQINAIKDGNAKVLLADGAFPLLGNNSTINYHDLTGVIGNTLKAAIAMRQGIIAANGNSDEPILCKDDSDLESKIREITERGIQKRAAVKTEFVVSGLDTSYSDDGSDSEPASVDGSLSSAPSRKVSSMESTMKGSRPCASNGNHSMSPSNHGSIDRPINDQQATKPSPHDRSGSDDSDDDYLDAILDGPPTFPARPRGKVIKSSTSNNEMVVEEGSPSSMSEKSKMTVKSHRPIFGVKNHNTSAEEAISLDRSNIGGMLTKLGMLSNMTHVAAKADPEGPKVSAMESTMKGSKPCPSNGNRNVSPSDYDSIDWPIDDEQATKPSPPDTNGSDDSDDDYLDAILDGPPTFPARPHAKIIKPATANNEMVVEEDSLSSMSEKSKMTVKYHRPIFGVKNHNTSAEDVISQDRSKNGGLPAKLGMASNMTHVAAKADPMIELLSSDDEESYADNAAAAKQAMEKSGPTKYTDAGQEATNKRSIGVEKCSSEVPHVKSGKSSKGVAVENAGSHSIEFLSNSALYEEMGNALKGGDIARAQIILKMLQSSQN